MIALACGLSVLAGVALALKSQRAEERRLLELAQQLERLQADRPLPARAPPRMTLARPPPQIDPLTLEGIPAYPQSTPRNLASSLKAQGMDLKIGWFETRDTQAQVLAFYEQKITQAGRIPVTHRYSAKAAYVGYLDTRNQKLHLVTVIENQGKSLVFPSSSQPGKFLSSVPALPPSLPVMPGASGGVVFDFDEGQQARRSYFATVSDRSVAEVADFYAKAFVEKGWVVEASKEPASSEARIDAHRKAGTCKVLVQKQTDKVAIYATVAGEL